MTSVGNDSDLDEKSARLRASGRVPRTRRKRWRRNQRSESVELLYWSRMQAKLGASKAIMATAHKLAGIIYHMVTKGQEYHETICAQNEIRHSQNLEARLRKQPRKLVLQLVAAS